MRKLLFLYIGLTAAVFAQNDPWVQMVQDSWRDVFDFVNSYMWLLAFLPVVITLYAIVEANKAISSESGQQMGQNQRPGLEKAKIMVFYVVGAILSTYIIYGTFGVVYVELSSFQETWERLVTDFWFTLFSRTTP